MGDKVKFLKGTQTSLNNLSSFEKGAFYLTTDTDRLYFAQETNELRPLNQFIRTITTVSELPQNSNPAGNHYDNTLQAGDYYYITNGNIFCVRNGANNDWTQINAVTDTNDHLDSASFAASASNNTATITESFVVHDVDDNLVSNAVADATFQVEGTNGIDVAASGSKITLEGDTYTLGGTTTFANFQNATAYAVGDIVKNGGELYRCKTAVSAEQNSNNFNTVSTSFEKINAAVSLNSAHGQDTSGAGFKAGSGITIGQTGNMITITNSGEDTTLAQNGFTIADTANSGNGFSFSVADTAGNAPSATFDPTITVGDASTQSIHFVDGDAALPVYTKSEIDSKLSGLDGITYKGTIGSSGATVTALPTTNVSNGDMYMVLNDNTTYAGHTNCRKGDLFIAQGTEGADGKISGTITWTYVPSGNDEATENTTYKGVADATNHKLQLQTNDDSHTTVSELDLNAADSKITLSSTASVDGIQLVTTIGHGSVGTGSAVSATAETKGTDVESITAVVGVLADSTGHVSGVKTKEFEIHDSTYTLSGSQAALTTSGATKIVTVTDTLTGSYSDNSSAAFKLKTDTLAASVANNNEITIDLEWGSFPSQS